MARKFPIIGRTISWWFVLVLTAIVIWAGLVCNTNASRLNRFHKFEAPNNTSYGVSLSKDFTRKYEYHEVQEGETLYSIMEKFGDPDLLENNPHIVDVDDIIPGLLIQVTDYHRMPKKSLS